MEMTLAILMALGIFVGVPVMTGLVVAGGFVAIDRRTYKAVNTAAKGEKTYTKTF